MLDDASRTLSRGCHAASNTAVIIKKTAILLIHWRAALKGQATLMATPTPKRLKRPSSFEFEPIFNLCLTLKGRRTIHAMHIPAWRALGRKHTHFALTYRTYAVLPERMWTRTFRPHRVDV